MEMQYSKGERDKIEFYAKDTVNILERELKNLYESKKIPINLKAPNTGLPEQPESIDFSKYEDDLAKYKTLADNIHSKDSILLKRLILYFSHVEPKLRPGYVQMTQDLLQDFVIESGFTSEGGEGSAYLGNKLKDLFSEFKKEYLPNQKKPVVA